MGIRASVHVGTIPCRYFHPFLDMGKSDKNLGTSRRKHLQTTRFPLKGVLRVKGVLGGLRQKGPQNEAPFTRRIPFKGNLVKLFFLPGRTLLWLVLKSVVGKAQNEAWGGVWAAHASQGCGLGRLKMKHGEGVGLLKTNHEKGVEFFVVPKSAVGRVWEASKWSMGRGLGCPCFPRMGWKGVRKGLAPCPGRRMFQDSYWGTFLRPIFGCKMAPSPKPNPTATPKPSPSNPQPQSYGKPTSCWGVLGLPRWELAGTKD